MISPLNFPMLTNQTFLKMHFCTLNPLAAWLTFGQLAENPVVTPTTSTQVARASAENRFLQSVTVEPIPTTPSGT